MYLGGLVGSKDRKRQGSDYVALISKNDLQKGPGVSVSELCILILMFTSTRPVQQIVFAPPEMVYLRLRSV